MWPGVTGVKFVVRAYTGQMRALCFLLLAVGTSGQTPPQQVARVLDEWHRAAAAADEPRYFYYFAPNGVFMGTDATERWTVAEFRVWAKPHFASHKAWNFHPHDRHIHFSADGKTSWFDEMLDTPNLGPSRGSGVLVLIGRDWKIAQYDLSVPIPNALMQGVVEKIRNAASGKR
jgi:hypothetical protein